MPDSAQAPANVIEAAKNIRRNLDAFEKAILNTKAGLANEPLLVRMSLRGAWWRVENWIGVGG
jgi:hypothetical protein